MTDPVTRRGAGVAGHVAGLPEPPGFPDCADCPYLRTGPPQVCAACAARALRPVSAPKCPRCSQALADGRSCANELCRDPRRRIGRISAIAELSGQLRSVLNRYKYGGARYYAPVFGRMVLRWLGTHPDEFDLIVANPSYSGSAVPGSPGPAVPGSPGATVAGWAAFPHAEEVLRAAARDHRPDTDAYAYPFDNMASPAILKLRLTLRSADASAEEKRAVARELRAALRIPDPARIAGRRILVYDDICTTGSQLNAVAACLIEDGAAASVDGLVLARTPWRR